MSYTNKFDDRVISNEEYVKIPADQKYQWEVVPAAEVLNGDFTSAPGDTPEVGNEEPTDAPAVASENVVPTIQDFPANQGSPAEEPKAE